MASPVSTDQVYDKICHMTETLISAIQGEAIKSKTGGVDQKIYVFVQKWVEFCRANQAAIIQKLSERTAETEPVLTQISLIDKEIKTLSLGSEATANSAVNINELLDRLKDVLERLRGAVQQQNAVKTTFYQLNKDVLVETISKMSKLSDLVRVGIISKQTRNIILDVATWKRSLAFRTLLVKQDAKESRQEFLDILRLYHGDRSPSKQAQKFALALAAEFFINAEYSTLKSFLIEIDRSDREFICELLKDQDLSKRQGLWLSYSNWIKDKPLNLNFLLTKCPNLMLLALAGNNNLKDEDLQAVARLVHLRTFYCSNCGNLKGDWLSYWGQPNNLEILDIGSCADFQPQKLALHLSKFNNLKTLKIQKLKLSDGDLEFLPKLTKLEVLDLSDNETLTDKTLAVLSRMPTLREINIKGLKGMTPDGYRQLHHALPQASIQHDPA